MEGGGSMLSAEPPLSHNNTITNEKMYEAQNDKLALTKDIYAYTFYCFVKNQNPVLIGELMIKCFFTIMLQFGIILFKFEEADQKNI
jgi:hypothetical protein